jgi:hypothetical protein
MVKRMLIGISINHYTEYESRVMFRLTEKDEAAKADEKRPNEHRKEGLVSIADWTGRLMVVRQYTLVVAWWTGSMCTGCSSEVRNKASICFLCADILKSSKQRPTFNSSSHEQNGGLTTIT